MTPSQCGGSGFDIGVYTLSKHPGDHLKYEFVRRRTYDYAMDRAQKKFDGILSRLADIHLQLADLSTRLKTLEFHGYRVQIEGATALLDSVKEKD